MRWAGRWASRRCSSSGREGVFELRRGFALEPGERVLMVEDVVTTGLSSREAIAAIEAAGGKVVAEAALVDRSGGKAELGVPFTPLIRIDVPTYDADDAAARAGRDSARSSPEAAPPRDPADCASASISTMSRPSGTRAAASIPTRSAPRIMAAEAGADGITAHLREDRRHITDEDIDRLMAEIDLPLNLEMAATEEMLAIALRHSPHAACIVPEKREERTTEGGLDAAGQHDHLRLFRRQARRRRHPRQPVHRAQRAAGRGRLAPRRARSSNSTPGATPMSKARSGRPSSSASPTAPRWRPRTASSRTPATA